MLDRQHARRFTQQRRPLYGVGLILVFLAALISRPSAATGAAVAQPAGWVPDGPVLTSALVGNTIYIGGQFRYIGPITGGFAVLDQATAYSVANAPVVDGSITAMTPDGTGGWYIGGRFTSVNQLPRDNLAHI